ncbi:hypothetical protein D3C83_215240 [compost metagenome]
MIPRITRKESKGERIAPADFCTKANHSPSLAALAIRAPPIESLWPFKNFVVEWSTKSAPSSKGRCR